MRTATKILLLITAITFFGFEGNKRNLAEVNQIQGFYIYTDSKPVLEYEYLGEVHTAGGITLRTSSQYTDVRNTLIKKAKKEFPRADGLILTFVTGSSDRCEAIRLK